MVTFPTEGDSLLQNLSTAIPVPLPESSAASPRALLLLARAVQTVTMTEPSCPVRCSRLAAQWGVFASHMAARWPARLLRLLEHGFVSVTLPWALHSAGAP